MKSCLFLLLLGGVFCAAQPKKMMYVTASAKTGRPAEPGKVSEAQSIAEMAESATTRALSRKFPCMLISNRIGLNAKLKEVRERQLAGSDEQATLVALGKRVGAEFLLDISVTKYQGKTAISMSGLNTRSIRPVAKVIWTLPAKADDIPAALEEFASRFADSMAGSVPKCAVREWYGTVTWSMTVDLSGTGRTGKPMREVGKATASCIFTRDPSGTTCSYQSESTLTTNGVTIVPTKTGPSQPNRVSVQPVGGQLEIFIGILTLKHTMSGAVSTEPVDATVNVASFRAPAGGDPKRQSGSWMDPNPGLKERGMTIKATWSPSRD